MPFPTGGDDVDAAVAVDAADDRARISVRAVVATALAVGSVGFVAAASGASAAAAPLCTTATGSSNGPRANGNGTFSQVYVGTSATFVVPDGYTSVTVDVCGAQGSGEAYNGPPGGAGGRVTAQLAVTPGQTLSVTAGTRSGSLGGGGTGAGPNGGGNGGGFSSVYTTGPAQAPLVIAGGGGGGSGGGAGGAGGGSVGSAGAFGIGAKHVEDNAGPGTGGSSDHFGTGGRAGGYGFASPGTNGASLQGGNGGAGKYSYLGGGGGGGGYYGGGGGGGGGDDYQVGSGAGGGGGAGFASGNLTGVTTAQGVRGGDGAVVVTYGVVVKQDQTVSFGSLPNATYGDSPLTPSATASSGLPVTYSVGQGDQCTVDGATVTFTGAGSCTVTAAQPGNDDYNAAPNVAQTFAIGKQSIPVTVMGLQTSGPTIAFDYGYDSLPADVTLAGDVTCTTLDGGQAVGAGLDIGDYTLDGGSCSGVEPSDDVNYVVTYAGSYSVLEYTPAPVDETVNGGSLGFVADPGAVAPPATTLNGTDQLTSPFALPLDIGDATGSGNGWNVSLSATPFTDADNRALGALFQATEATPSCDAGTTCAVGADAASLIHLGSVGYDVDSLVAAADSGTGMGNQSLAPTFTLAVPANSYAGAYTSTWTVSLNSAPH